MPSEPEVQSGDRSPAPLPHLRAIRPEDRDALRAIRSTPEVARWWDPPEPDFPEGDEPDVTRLSIVLGDLVVGMIQFGEELDPKYRSASVDLFVDPAHHRRGIASAAIAQVLEILVDDRGHHRVTIDPAAANAPAIRCYEKAGFRRVGILRAAERDSDGGGWHDQLLMEWLAPTGEGPRFTGIERPEPEPEERERRDSNPRPPA